MIDCSFVNNEVYGDFYFLLEMAEIPWIPTPHRELLGRVPLPARVAEAVAGLRTAPSLQPGDASDNLFLEAVELRDHQQMAALLDKLRGRESAIGATDLIGLVVDTRSRTVSSMDMTTAADLIVAARELLGTQRVRAVIHQLREFFSIGPRELSLTLAPYPLSSECAIAFGSLTGNLITLGIHPSMSPERVIGLVVHEAVHAWFNWKSRQADSCAAEFRSLEEPLATAIGNAWTVERVSGLLPAHSWYDKSSVDEDARRLYGSVSAAILAGRKFESVAQELSRALEPESDGHRKVI
jgi:hypothetical protein